jgi:taurine dioxygenase
MKFDVAPVTAAIGAEISGLDLGARLDEHDRDALRGALNRHLVLFARGQHLDDAAHEALASVFGAPMVHPFEAALGRTEPLHRIVDRAERTPDRAGWHTDDSYLERPPAVAVLRCEVAPEAGGDTAWANMILAYEKLSGRMRGFLDPLRGFHETGGSLLEYMRAHLPPDAIERVLVDIGAGAEHPIVRTHPYTGQKAIYLEPNFLTRIADLPALESDFVCRFLSTLAHDVSLQCRFRWGAGDVAIWDERVTQHIGAADHAGSDRVMVRCTVEGERPR